MSDDWREELIKQITTAIAVHAQDSEDGWWIWEPAEDAAAIAKEHLTDAIARVVAAAIRGEGA